MIYNDCEFLFYRSPFLVSVVHEIFEPGCHDFHLAACVHHENRCQATCGDRNAVDDERRETLKKEYEFVCRTEVRV